MWRGNLKRINTFACWQDHRHEDGWLYEINAHVELCDVAVLRYSGRHLVCQQLLLLL
jgi:hypothetical protein